MALRVLVVDDSATARGLISRVLQQQGCEVVGLASSGAEALEAYPRIKPDFVTLDLVMPQMTGQETLRALKAQDPSAVVIVISSLGMMKTVMECVKAGASYYLVKPFKSEKVRAVLKKCFPDRVVETEEVVC
ncbi:MAG: response regulator [Deltaproteobacteria bacterium]|nr:response regulator [Deltaproteobacteria bacterium]